MTMGHLNDLQSSIATGHLKKRNGYFNLFFIITL